MRVYKNAFLSLVPRANRWSMSRSNCFIPRKRPSLTPVWAVGASQSLWTLCERERKKFPLAEKDSQIVNMPAHILTILTELTSFPEIYFAMYKSVCMVILPCILKMRHEHHSFASSTQTFTLVSTGYPLQMIPK